MHRRRSSLRRLAALSARFKACRLKRQCNFVAGSKRYLKRKPRRQRISQATQTSNPRFNRTRTSKNVNSSASKKLGRSLTVRGVLNRIFVKRIRKLNHSSRNLTTTPPQNSSVGGSLKRSTKIVGLRSMRRRLLSSLPTRLPQNTIRIPACRRGTSGLNSSPPSLRTRCPSFQRSDCSQLVKPRNSPRPSWPGRRTSAS